MSGFSERPFIHNLLNESKVGTVKDERTTGMKRNLLIVVLVFACSGGTLMLRAQVPPPAPDYTPFSGDQLDQLLGPIALYPDPLIAEILPAATQPEEIVEADRYVSGGGDPGAIDDQPWDPNVQGLAHYPDVLKWLDDNISWTTQLGEAFVNQQQDVMDSIQRLRQSAFNLGNLQSTAQQQVINDDGYIEIVPADPNTIYVPVYQPDQVYDQAATGVPFITFTAGWSVGAWLCGDFDWGHHQVIFWDHDHPRPPNWWHESWHNHDDSHGVVWHAGDHPVNRPDRGGDRGYDQQVAPRQQPVVAVIGHSRGPAPAARPAEPARQAAPAGHFEPAQNGAFIGVGNARQTQDYSDRGHQSLEPQTHSAPASHPSGGGGGGGGGHSSGGGGGHGFGGGGGGNRR